MLQMSWFLEQKCISMGFIKFWKNFEKFWKLADFGQKTTISRVSRVVFLVLDFPRKMYLVCGKFWAFFAKIKQNLLPRCTKWPRTRLTDKIWWFWNLVIVEDTLGHIYTKFGGDRSIFHRLDTFSVENRVPKKRCAIRAKWSFFGQKSANFQNFSKFFQNLIKPIKIHFWSKNQLIWSIFGHFMAI